MQSLLCESQLCGRFEIKVLHSTIHLPWFSRVGILCVDVLSECFLRLCCQPEWELNFWVFDFSHTATLERGISHFLATTFLEYIVKGNGFMQYCHSNSCGWHVEFWDITNGNWPTRWQALFCNKVVFSLLHLNGWTVAVVCRIRCGGNATFPPSASWVYACASICKCMCVCAVSFYC